MFLSLGVRIDRVLPFLLGACWMLASCVFAATVEAAQEKTVWHGVYADSQAQAGQEVYAQHCGSCHGPELAGGSNQAAPALKGEKFMENWREDYLNSLFQKTKDTMPRRSSKVLTETETLDVISYILRENTFPAGTDALNVTSLDAIRIERKDGPKPLPGNALIHGVGCLVKDGAGWTLTNASAPLRVRSAEAATASEMDAARAKPLGSLTFKLQNLIMLGAFKPEEHAGHKMLVKGALLRRSNSESISVTEMEMLSADCRP